MKFDKSKVFTTFNADEVKIGSKGYFSDFKENLISRVQSEDTEYYLTIKSIESDNDFCFRSNEGGLYRYFYLVEEPKEKTKRPCTREELIEMLKKQGLPMLKLKETNGIFTVLFIGKNGIAFVADITHNYEYICEHFTFLDDTELYVEE